MPKETVLRALISAIVARQNCRQSENTAWFSRHGDRIKEIEANYLPSGSGIDHGTSVDADQSSTQRLVLYASFHHMNDVGMYDGWTEHRITITADLLSGFVVRVSGRDRNQIKEYLTEIFRNALTAVCDVDL